MKKFVFALVLACFVATVPTVGAKTEDVVFSFDEGQYVTEPVPYSNQPCEDYWVSGAYTESWDGHDGVCVVTAATYAAAKAGDPRFTAKQRAMILKMKPMKSSTFGSPVSILDEKFGTPVAILDERFGSPVAILD